MQHGLVSVDLQGEWAADYSLLLSVFDRSIPNTALCVFPVQIIARLVAACRPYVCFSQLLTKQQLQQLIRLIVWKDQQQPWTVHAITCLLQDMLDADKQFNALHNAAKAAAAAAADGPDAMQMDEDEAPDDCGGVGQTDDDMNNADDLWPVSLKAQGESDKQLPSASKCSEWPQNVYCLLSDIAYRMSPLSPSAHPPR